MVTKTKPEVVRAVACSYEPDENDILEDCCRRAKAAVREVFPELDEATLAKADRQIEARFSQARDDWGGDRPYISRRPGQGRSGRNEAIRREHRAGERVPYLARRYQLTERRILQIISEPAGA